jgi:hypothetical protein
MALIGRRAEEERAAEKARKEAEAKHIAAERQEAGMAAEQQAAHERYLASPVGQADVARQRGDRFFQVSLVESQVKGKASEWAYADVTTTTRVGGTTDVLGQIEDLGWRLEHVGYVFVETGAMDRNKSFSSGTVTRTDGYVQGIYLFRAVRQTGKSWPGNAEAPA